MKRGNKAATSAPSPREDHERGPGRPSAESGPAVSRSDLLRIAARMIGRKGFAATSIRALGSEAGVSHGTVQHHFPTKDSLWKALVDEVIVPDLNHIRDRLLAEAESGLDAILAARLKQAMTRPGLPGAVLADRSHGAEDRLGYLADASQVMRDQSITQMQILIDGGLVRPIDPVALAALNLLLAFLASSDVVLSAFFDIDIADETQRDALVAGIVDIVLHGVVPRD